jgi:hypothetical protein
MFCNLDNRKQRTQTGSPFRTVPYGNILLPKYTITFFVYKVQHNEMELVYILGYHNLQFDCRSEVKSRGKNNLQEINQKQLSRRNNMRLKTSPCYRNLIKPK